MTAKFIPSIFNKRHHHLTTHTTDPLINSQ
jgi:hypothetical protein